MIRSLVVLAGLPVTLAASVLVGGARPASESTVKQDSPTALGRYLMGTFLTIEVARPIPTRVFDEAFAEVERLERILSNWKEESEISRLNRRGDRESFRCSPELFGAIQTALRWAERTGGAFDPTVEPVVRRLGLRGPEGQLPAIPDTVEPRLEGFRGEGTKDDRAPASVVGWRHVMTRRVPRRVCFDHPGMGIDLGGIGKGIALDAAAAILARHGVRSALLDFGGQVLAIGSPAGSHGWSVGIADPGERQAAVATVLARDVSLSTSGNGERALQSSSGPLGHIIDPWTGEPARFGGTVTVLAFRATSADALSTALFVMGPERGAAWAEQRSIAALFLWREPGGSLGRKATPAFERLLHESRVTRNPPGFAGARP